MWSLKENVCHSPTSLQNVRKSVLPNIIKVLFLIINIALDKTNNLSMGFCHRKENQTTISEQVLCLSGFLRMANIKVSKYVKLVCCFVVRDLAADFG